jgi:hypothetical protein
MFQPRQFSVEHSLPAYFPAPADGCGWLMALGSVIAKVPKIMSATTAMAAKTPTNGDAALRDDQASARGGVRLMSPGRGGSF